MDAAVDRRAVLRFGAALVGSGLALPGCGSGGRGPADGSDSSVPAFAHVQLTGDLRAGQLASIGADAEKAALAVIGFWGPGTVWRADGRARIRAFEDQAGFVAAGGDPDERAITATTTEAGQVLMGPHLVVAPTPARIFVLTHELTHVRLGVRSAAERWVAEGAAELTALLGSGMTLTAYAPTLAARVRAGRIPDRPPMNDALDASAADLRTAYQTACAFSLFLLGRVGPDRYRRYVESAIGRHGPDGGPVFEASFGARVPGLAPAFRSWLRQHVAAGR